MTMYVYIIWKNNKKNFKIRINKKNGIYMYRDMI